MIAATHTIGSRSFLRGPQVRATGPQQAQRARTVSRIVCEDAPEKKSAIKAKATTLRYEKRSALCRTPTAGRTALCHWVPDDLVEAHCPMSYFYMLYKYTWWKFVAHTRVKVHKRVAVVVLLLGSTVHNFHNGHWGDIMN